MLGGGHAILFPLLVATMMRAGGTFAAVGERRNGRSPYDRPLFTAWVAWAILVAWTPLLFDATGFTLRQIG